MDKVRQTLRQAAQALLDQYSKHYLVEVGKAKLNAPLLEEVAALDAALRAESQPPSASGEREAFEAAMVEEGYDKPQRGMFADSQYLYECDQDRFVGWQLARAALAPSPGIDAAEQKPVGYVGIKPSTGKVYGITWFCSADSGHQPDGEFIPVYAAPPAAQPSAAWVVEAERLVDTLIRTVVVETQGKTFTSVPDVARAALLAHLRARP